MLLPIAGYFFFFKSEFWCWEGLGAGEGDVREWNDWMASLTRWTWVWVNCRSWWWTGRPGMLWFMVSQRVRHNWAAELNWTELIYTMFCLAIQLWTVVHSSYSSCFHILVIINNAALNMEMQITFLDCWFISFECILRREVAWPYDHSIFIVLKHLYTVFLLSLLIYIPNNSVWGFSFSLATLEFFFF